jgi:NAD-dependent deacetylase
VIIGTSLQVYPAAGLIDFAPPFAPRFLIDRAEVQFNPSYKIEHIQKPATEGIIDLMEKLSAL